MTKKFIFLLTLLFAASWLAAQEVVTVPYSMGFEDNEPHDQWLIVNANTDAQTWKRSNATGSQAANHSGSYGMSYQFTNVVADDWFFSPKITLEENKAYNVSFWVRAQGAKIPFSVNVATEQSAGSVVNTVLNSNSMYTNWTKIDITLSGYETGEYSIGFYTNHRTNLRFIKIDDFLITEMSSVDAELLSFPNLELDYYGAGHQDVNVNLSNLGALPLTSATINWSVNGSTQTPIDWTGSLAENQVTTVLLGSMNMPSNGEYVVVANVLADGDNETSNNEITTTVIVRDPINTLPYTTEFDGNLDYWVNNTTVGNKMWQWATNHTYLKPASATANNGFAVLDITQSGGVGPAATAALVSPGFDFSSITGHIGMRFDQRLRNVAQAITVKVQASTDYFKNDIRDMWAFSFPAGTSQGDAINTQLVDLTSLTGTPHLKLRFLFDGTQGYGWAVDDININVIENSNDIQVSSASCAATMSIQGDNVVLYATVENAGYDAQTNLPVTFNVNGTDLVYTIPTIAVGEKLNITMNWPNSAGGAHFVTVSVPNDQNNSNNTKTFYKLVKPTDYIGEGFNSETFPPENWSVDTDSWIWRYSTAYIYEGAGSTTTNTLGEYQNLKLITPLVNIANEEWMGFYAKSDGSDTTEPNIQVMYSKDKKSWAPIGDLITITPLWTAYKVDLSSIEGIYYLAISASGSTGVNNMSRIVCLDHVIAPPQVEAYDITFNVKDADTQEPISAATISYQGSQTGSLLPTGSIMTDAQGTATVELPTGSYTANASKANYKLVAPLFAVGVSSFTVDIFLTPSMVTPPENVQANIVEGNVVINWQKQIGATHESYFVYRLIEGQPETEWVQLGYTASTEFTYTDTDWLSLPQGNYQYAVVAYAEETMSSAAFSNVLLNSFEFSYSVQITTNNGNSPVGAAIVLTNQDGIEGHSYTLTSDENGAIFENIWRGVYNISITKAGYATYNATNLLIHTAGLSHIAVLEEAKDNPVNLQVVQDGYNAIFTWEKLEPSVATYTVYLDGIEQASALSVLTHTFTNVSGGEHTAGVKAVFATGESGTVNITFTMNVYTVTFNVENSAGQPVENAIVAINNQLIVTNSSGEVAISLINGTYPYTVTKADYLDVTDNVIVENSSQIVDIELISNTVSYTINVSTNAGYSPAGAVVVLTNQDNDDAHEYTRVVDETGVVTINNAAVGTYDLTITKAAFETYTASDLTIGAAELSHTAVLIEKLDEPVNIEATQDSYDLVLTWEKQDYASIVSYTIYLDNEEKANTISALYYRMVNVPKGDHTIGIKAVYETGESEIVEINFTMLLYTITFNATNNGSALEGVVVAINNQTLTTNAQGTSEISLITGEYPYSATKAGYSVQNGNVTVANVDQTVNIDLVENQYTVTFLANSGGAALEGVEIAINNQTLTTNAQGTTEISLITGEYPYSATKAGYSVQNGNVTVADVNQTVNISLTEILYPYSVTITTNAGYSPEGATVKLTNNTSGTVYTETAGENGVEFDNIPFGNYELLISLGGFADYTTQLVVDSENTSHSAELIEKIDAPVNLQAAQNGNHVDLTWEKADDASEAQYTVYLNGRVVHEGVLALSYTLTNVEQEENTAGIQAVYVTGESETIDVEFTMEFFTATFHVTDNNNTPVEGATVTVNAKKAIEITNSEGIAEFRLGSSAYTYTVEKDGYSTKEGEITINGADLTEEIELDLLGIYETGTDAFNLYPNPTQNNLFVDRTETGMVTVEILNSIGSIIYNVETNETKMNIDVSNFNSGIYIIRFIDENKTVVTKRFIKM